MGVFLDSSVIIQAERLGHSETRMLRGIAQITGEQDIALSAVVLTELIHAVYRAKTESARLRREQFISQLVQDVPVYPYDQGIATLAGRIGGQQAAQGITVPFADLLIGATALHHGFAILTANIRHFALIPGLEVVQF